MTVTLNVRADWLGCVMQSTVSDAAKMRAYSLFALSDDKGHHFENQPEIEAAIGHSSTGKTSKHLWELADAGFVVIERKRVNSGHMSNGYWLALGGMPLVGHTIVGTKRRNLRVAHTPVCEGSIDSYLGDDGADTRPMPDWAVPHTIVGTTSEELPALGHTIVGTTSEGLTASPGSDSIIGDLPFDPHLSLVTADDEAQSLAASSGSLLKDVVPTLVGGSPEADAGHTYVGASRRRCHTCQRTRSSEMFVDHSETCFTCERKSVSA